MARKRGGHNSRGGVISIVGTIIAIVLAAVVLTQSGAWNTVSQTLGIGRPVGDVNGLRASGKDKQKPNLRLPTDARNQAERLRDGLRGLTGGQTSPQAGQAGTAGSGLAGLPAASRAPISYQQALDEARSMPVSAAHPQGYNRMQYFGTWQPYPQMGGRATTRDYVLKRDMTNVTLNRYNQVQSGTFHDPYTNQIMQFKRGKDTSALIQVDHVVALQDAWSSGLWQDSRAGDRMRYANDPDVLLASEGKANMAKGAGMDWQNDSNPVWLTPYEPYHCDYMAKRVYIKNKWHLSMTAGEKNQTTRLLEACVVKK